MLASHVVTTVNQRVLGFLAKYCDREFYERQIASSIGIAYGSANRSLHKLYNEGVIRRRQQGRMLFYSIDINNPAIKNYKILVNVMLIEPLVEELKTVCQRIIMFGSCAEGTDSSQSDLDFFIVTSDEHKVREILERYTPPKGFEDVKLNPVIKTPVELLQAGESESTFLEEVERGIVLWEKSADER